MSAEPADGWVMQTWRAGTGGRGQDRCKALVVARRMKWIIDDRPSRDEGLDVTLWNWLKGQGPWGSATGLGAGSCGAGLSLDSTRRCCLFQR